MYDPKLFFFFFFFLENLRSLKKVKRRWRQRPQADSYFFSLNKEGMATSLDHFFLAPSAATRLPKRPSLGVGKYTPPVSLFDAPLLARLAHLLLIGWE
jgi:hypothetical protein